MIDEPRCNGLIRKGQQMGSALLDASIVALLSPAPESIEKLSPRDVQHFMEGPVTVSQMPDGNVVVTSMRGRLELQIKKSRVEVKDWSGIEAAQSHAPAAMKEALRLARGKVKALGMNYELEAKVDMPAGQYAAKQLLSYDRLSNLGRPLGKSIAFQLVSPDDGQEYNIVVQPRWGNIEGRDIFININIPVRVTESPAEEVSLDTLQEAFRNGWERAKDLAEKLLAG